MSSYFLKKIVNTAKARKKIGDYVQLKSNDISFQASICLLMGARTDSLTHCAISNINVFLHENFEQETFDLCYIIPYFFLASKRIIRSFPLIVQKQVNLHIDCHYLWSWCLIDNQLKVQVG